MTNTKTKSRNGMFFIAPASDPSDPYAAGFEGNAFTTEKEAADAIDDLVLTAFPETTVDDWCVSAYSP